MLYFLRVARIGLSIQKVYAEDPQRCWLELNLEIALPVLKAYAEYTAQEYRYDAVGLKHMLTKDTGFEAYLVTAPTRQKGLFARFVKQLANAWQPQDSKPQTVFRLV